MTLELVDLLKRRPCFKERIRKNTMLNEPKNNKVLAEVLLKVTKKCLPTKT